METLEHYQNLVKRDQGPSWTPQYLSSSPHIYSLFNTYVLKSLKISYPSTSLHIHSHHLVQVRSSIPTVTAILSVPLIVFSLHSILLSQGASCTGRQKRENRYITVAVFDAETFVNSGEMYDEGKTVMR